jgi:hypothetical protein
MEITKENIKELVGRRFKNFEHNVWDAKINKITKNKVHFQRYSGNISSEENVSVDNFIEWINKGTWIFIKDSIQQPTQTPPHYDNTNGSLYLFAEQHGLNAWEFDILKRVVRCRKKGEFETDLKKTIEVINLYLKEYEPNTTTTN